MELEMAIGAACVIAAPAALAAILGYLVAMWLASTMPPTQQPPTRRRPPDDVVQ
jgi:hypothetical protein